MNGKSNSPSPSPSKTVRRGRRGTAEPTPRRPYISIRTGKIRESYARSDRSRTSNAYAVFGTIEKLGPKPDRRSSDRVLDRVDAVGEFEAELVGSEFEQRHAGVTVGRYLVAVVGQRAGDRRVLVGNFAVGEKGRPDVVGLEEVVNDANGLLEPVCRVVDLVPD